MEGIIFEEAKARGMEQALYFVIFLVLVGWIVFKHICNKARHSYDNSTEQKSRDNWLIALSELDCELTAQATVFILSFMIILLDVVTGNGLKNSYIIEVATNPIVWHPEYLKFLMVPLTVCTMFGFTCVLHEVYSVSYKRSAETGRITYKIIFSIGELDFSIHAIFIWIISAATTLLKSLEFIAWGTPTSSVLGHLGQLCEYRVLGLSIVTTIILIISFIYVILYGINHLFNIFKRWR